MTDYEKLKKIIDEIDVLIKKKVSASDPDFEAWHIKAERFLIKTFGKDSLEHKKFKDTSFSLMLFTLDTPHSEFIKACSGDLQTTKAVFSTYLEEMQETNMVLAANAPQPQSAFTKIFLSKSPLPKTLKPSYFLLKTPLDFRVSKSTFSPSSNFYLSGYFVGEGLCPLPYNGCSSNRNLTL